MFKANWLSLIGSLLIGADMEALCVDLISSYTLTDRDKKGMNFMCLTMVDPSSSWFEMVELPGLTVNLET